MKNQLINKAILSITCFIGGLLCISCGDWTDMESIKLTEPNIKDQNPGLYTGYLENLRNYRKSDHYIVYAWFDNSEKVPFSRGQHISQVPDSLDVIALMYPDNLADWELEEMNSLRQEKAMEIIYTVSYDAIKSVHTNLITLYENDDKGVVAKPKDWISFMTDSVNHALSLLDTYGYDGICISYAGKSTIHMTDEEAEEYTTAQNTFFSLVNNVVGKQTGKRIVFEGKTQYLADKTFLQACTHIIIPILDVSSKDALTYNIITANVDGVPSDRFIVTAQTTSLEGGSIGYWSDGSLALYSTASWVMAAHTGFTVAGLGIYNVNTEYFNSDYTVIKETIGIMNPSLKK
ncbi:MAG: glycoside hydrolase family 18 [Tannerellaceae bacterium]|nr:glycoside hydrolase family 18 [Tannerellaceae bacterium]